MRSILTTLALILVATANAEGPALHLVGSTVTPHFLAETMRYSRDPEPATGARVQLFLRNDSSTNAAPLTLDASLRTTLNGKAPADLLKDGRLGWHDFPVAMPAESLALPPGAMTVWTFNSRKEDSAPAHPCSSRRARSRHRSSATHSRWINPPRGSQPSPSSPQRARFNQIACLFTSRMSRPRRSPSANAASGCHRIPRPRAHSSRRRHSPA